jgi:hypothetical protein
MSSKISLEKLTQKMGVGWVQWLILIVPATWKMEIGELWFEANLGKKLARAYFKEARCGGSHL